MRKCRKKVQSDRLSNIIFLLRDTGGIPRIEERRSRKGKSKVYVFMSVLLPEQVCPVSRLSQTQLHKIRRLQSFCISQVHSQLQIRFLACFPPLTTSTNAIHPWSPHHTNFKRQTLPSHQLQQNKLRITIPIHPRQPIHKFTPPRRRCLQPIQAIISHAQKRETATPPPSFIYSPSHIPSSSIPRKK